MNYDIRYTSYANRRNTPQSIAPPNKPPNQPKLSTNYDLFMQNKPNFPDAQMNVNKEITKDYENETLSGCGKNKPNSKPNKANSKPISPETKPIQTQYEPKQTQFFNPTYPQKHALPALSLSKGAEPALSVVEWAEGAATELRCRISEITCLWQLQFMAHSGTMPSVNRVSCVWSDCYKVSIRPWSIRKMWKECQK